MANDVSTIWQSLLGKIKNRGHSEQDILRVVDQQGDGLLEKVADVLTEATHTPPREVYPIQVNYDLPLRDAIDAGDYQAVNASITGDNFPQARHGHASLEIFLMRFVGRMTSEEVINALSKEDLRPADLPEFLAFGAAYPQEQRRFSIICLGSVWQDKKHYRNVPCLYEASEARSLDLHWWDDGWYSYSRFAAVRK